MPEALPTGLSGRLLIAMPQLEGGPFERAVVLIARHDADHAFGLIVNKPIDGVTAAKAIPGATLKPDLMLGDAPLYLGGPCAMERGMVLHSDEFSHEETISAGPGLSITGRQEALAHLSGQTVRPARARVFAGHAGWSPGQLDDELRRGFWLDADAEANFVFETAPEEMWQAAIESLGITAGHLFAMPVSEDGAPQRLN